jgi:hypothetical protein
MRSWLNASAILLFFAVVIQAGELHPSANQWNLTDYLKGTPEQIRALLYKDIIRLDRSVRDTERAFKEAEAELEKDKAESLDICHKRPDFIAAKAERDAAAKALVSARNGGTSEDRLSASSRYNRAKAITDRLEADSISKNTNIRADQGALNASVERLADQKKSLADAIAWKDRLVSAALNSLKLEGPLDPGASGFLGTVKVEDVQDNTVILDFLAFEARSETDTGEGLGVKEGVARRVKLLVSRSDTGDCHRGSLIMLNRTFKVASMKVIDDETFYMVRPSPSDEDALWKVLTTPITDAELSRGAAGG